MSHFSAALFDECICDICFGPACDGDHSDAPLGPGDAELDAEWWESWLAEQETQGTIVASQYPI